MLPMPLRSSTRSLFAVTAPTREEPEQRRILARGGITAELQRGIEHHERVPAAFDIVLECIDDRAAG